MVTSDSIESHLLRGIENSQEANKTYFKNELENNYESNSNKINLNKDQKRVRKTLKNKIKKEKKENKKSKLKFLKDRESIKKAIILKEILDKPLGMRKEY